ncbi:MAG: catalase, partial [Pedobacter sp.]
VKFHWKPLLGVHSVAWEEAQQISGKDPDFHRRDLWEAIQSGNFPEWELGIQVVAEADEHKFDFDLLDPTKIIPEELVPVQRIGKLTLNRNPENFFAETEQVAFHVGHVVPGIDFTNDPLLQGRLFSYTDTQLIRLGGPNFHEIPINRPIVPVHNNHRDGFMRQTINRGKSSYGPNSIANNDPQQVKIADGGFSSHNERIDARKIRARSKSFFDHFSQAKLFYHSQSVFEQNHIIDALSFELGKVKTVAIRERMVGILMQIDQDLAKTVAANLGITSLPKPASILNHSIPADGDPKDYQPIVKKPSLKKSEALSMANTIKDTIKSRKIAFLIADGVDVASVNEMKKALEDKKATVELIAPKLGLIEGLKNQSLTADESFLTAASVLYDAVFIPSGDKSMVMLSQEPDAIHFINQAFTTNYIR